MPNPNGQLVLTLKPSLNLETVHWKWVRKWGKAKMSSLCKFWAQHGPHKDTCASTDTHTRSALLSSSSVSVTHPTEHLYVLEKKESSKSLSYHFTWCVTGIVSSLWHSLNTHTGFHTSVCVWDSTGSDAEQPTAAWRRFHMKDISFLYLQTFTAQVQEYSPPPRFVIEHVGHDTN